MKRILIVQNDPQYIQSLPSGFVSLGYQVKILNEASYEKVLQAFKLFRPHLVVTMGWSNDFKSSDEKIYLRKCIEIFDAFHIYWATEDPRWLYDFSLKHVNKLKPNLILTIHPDSIPIYRENGYKAEYLEWGCNPAFNKSIPPTKQFKVDIALIATCARTWKSYRKTSLQHLLKPIVNGNYNLAIWGKDWEKFNYDLLGFKIPSEFIKGKLPFANTNDVYNSAKIILGLQNDTEMLTSRTFEVLSSGGFLVTSKTNAVKKYFVNEKHLLMSKSPEETKEIVDYYLYHGQERKAIAKAGQLEVQQNHTYKHRAKRLLQLVDYYSLGERTWF